MKIFQLLILSSFFVSALFVPNSYSGNIYYVDGTNGNDHDNDGSCNSPWRTIDKANKKLEPGDIVYIKAGIYQQTIEPENSGTEGNYITFSRYNCDNVIIKHVDTAVDLNGKSYIIIDGLKIGFVNKDGGWVDMSDGTSHHNIIRNCYFEAGNEYNGIYLDKGSSFNRIINNTLKGYCGECTPLYGGPSDLIKVTGGSHHNLIEGNKCYNASHIAIAIMDSGTEYNIVRNNYIQNKWHTNLCLFPAADHSLVEGNIIMDAGEDHQNNRCGSESDKKMARWVHTGLQNGSSYSIIRKNIFVNNGNNSLIPKAEAGSASKNCRLYHNTFFENYFGIYINTAWPTYGHKIINNIFYDNRCKEISIFMPVEVMPVYLPDSLYFDHNNIASTYPGCASLHYFGRDLTLSELERQYPKHWKHNLSLNPEFVDVANGDFKLRPYSPMIDAGIFLTKTISSGPGKTIQVDDASYFMDGWRLINGDIIQLEGQTQTAMITRIDYINNIITVDRNLTWRRGVGVSLAYQGSAPDIGAFEFVQDALMKNKGGGDFTK